MTPTVPLRHPPEPREFKGLKPVAALLRLTAPSQEQWDELGEALTVGDTEMDNLVAWMTEEGLDRTRPMFEQAVNQGVDSVADAPEPLREFFVRIETPPPWLDREQVRRGARVFRTGGSDGLYVARDVSFLGGYLASGFNQTLIRTGALEKGPAQRFAETMQWALDVTSEGGLEPLGHGVRSTIRVRFIHAIVRRHVVEMPDWRSEEWGLPINQTDMAATLVGALIAPFIGGMAMGIVPTRADVEAAAHLTRYVGWLIGVEDRFLPNDFRDGVRLLYHALSAITNPDETTRQLALPMADDPRNWHYRYFPRLRARIARAQHLSISGTFLGRRAMRRLGLPAYMPPWYPMLRVPVNLVRSAGSHFVPGGRDRAAARGRRAQETFLRTLIGRESAVVGGSLATREHAV